MTTSIVINLKKKKGRKNGTHRLWLPSSSTSTWSTRCHSRRRIIKVIVFITIIIIIIRFTVAASIVPIPVIVVIIIYKNNRPKSNGFLFKTQLANVFTIFHKMPMWKYCILYFCIIQHAGKRHDKAKLYNDIQIYVTIN